MSTRSLICKEQPDGSYYGIYCHSDGYLTYNGAMLVDHYSDAKKVDELLSFGDMAVLKQKTVPDPTRPHSFDYNERQDDVSVFYGRDRGETNTEARIITIKDIMNSWCNYLYVFGKDGVWRYSYILNGIEPKELANVREDLNAKYRELGIKRPKGFYGYWTPETIANEKLMQEILSDYDEYLSYNENLIKKVNAELEEFKNDMLAKPPAEIYNAAGKIHFYEYMAGYIEYEEIDEEQSETLYKSDKHILYALWNKMLELDDFNIANEGDADYLVKEHIKDCKIQSEQM